MTRRVLFSVCAVLLFAPIVCFAGYRVEVEQGGVARWDGEDIESCAMDGRVFPPVDGSCWYPVDFARDPDHVEIARWTESGGRDLGWLVIVSREFESQDIEFPDDRYIHLSEEDATRHYGEQARSKPLFRRGWSSEGRFSIPLRPPADNLPAGGGFGAHRTFNGEPRNRHTGTDYPIPAGNAVKAVADGDVVIAEEHFFAGLGVYIHHGNGLYSQSFHFQSADVEAGQSVEAGDKIGEVGSTGRSTGPHLHFGLRWRGARIDSAWLLDKAASIPAVQDVD